MYSGEAGLGMKKKWRPQNAELECDSPVKSFHTQDCVAEASPFAFSMLVLRFFFPL